VHGDGVVGGQLFDGDDLFLAEAGGVEGEC